MNNDTVTQIKDRLSIADVVQAYIPLEQSGKQFRARCPFHNEKTPSFYVNPDRSMFYCFGCQKGGDIFAFVQEIEKIDFKQALQLLAEKAGVTYQTVQQSAEHNRMRTLLQTASDVFVYCFKKSAVAEEYVKSRGITDESIAKFAIGYAPKQSDFLVSYLLKKGYKHDEIIAAGVAIKTERGQVIDRFRGRVMFPLTDSQGRVVSFTGRILPSFEKTGVAKYMNGPDTFLYHKSEILFGFYQAKEALRTKKTALLMEGQMDVVLAHQYGFAHAIAISGTALSDFHANAIHRYADTVYMCLDSDSAGMRAAEKNVWPLFAAELEVKVVSFPEKEDPASLFTSGQQAVFEQCIADSVSYVAFVLKQVKNIPLKEQYKKIEEHIYPWCRHIPNVILQDKTLTVVADTLGVSHDAVRKSFTTWLFSQNSGTFADTRNQATIAQAVLPRLEQTVPLIRLRAYATVQASTDADSVDRAHYINLLDGIVATYQPFISSLTEPLQQSLVETEMMRLAPMIESTGTEERVDFLNQTVKVFEQKCIEAAYQQMRSHILTLTKDDPSVPEKLAKMEELRKKIDTLSISK